MAFYQLTYSLYHELSNHQYQLYIEVLCETMEVDAVNGGKNKANHWDLLYGGRK